MINGHKVVALVPARGGSKGLLKKNLQKIAGQPLLCYTLRAALHSVEIDQTYLSSDDADILETGRHMGVELVRRPLEFASDTASASDVVMHFLKTSKESLPAQDHYLVYLQPTSPLRTSQHISEAFALMVKEKKHAVISVSKMRQTPFKALTIDEHGDLQPVVQPDFLNANRQDLPVAYLPNGAIYIFRVSDFFSANGFPMAGVIPYEMSEKDSIDVDSQQDLDRVEELMKDNRARI